MRSTVIAITPRRQSLSNMVLTDLHCLCASGDQTDTHYQKILKHIQAHPQEARQEQEDGKFALHYALENRAPLPIVASLVQAYPEALYCRETRRGQFPLHAAISSGCSADVVEYLIRQNPVPLSRRVHRDFLCCFEEYVLLCRGRTLKGGTCLELANHPKNPNREALVELLTQTDHANHSKDVAR